MKIKRTVDVAKLQKEYHYLCGKLITLDDDLGPVPFEDYINEFETIEERLCEIERELDCVGLSIDNHHMLCILR